MGQVEYRNGLASRLREWSRNCLIDGLKMDKGEPTLQQLLREAAAMLFRCEVNMGKAENTVAAYLVEQVKSVGGMCDKVHCESERGFPDYLITWPSGDMKKVETKSKNGACSPTQERYHRQSALRRCTVAVLHTRELVDMFMNFHRINWEGYP